VSSRREWAVDITFQSSVLFVRDIEPSRRFYEGLLGQEVVFDFGENVSFAGGFAIQQAEHIGPIIFGRPLAGAGPLGRENFELYFESEDLDAVWERLAEAGTPVIHPLREQPWSQRVFRVHDPDGHIVEIGEPMSVVVARFLRQGVSKEEAARRSSMPLEFVQQIAKNID
jgi:catechol 2,3-dioxygenase-like lactoylglutathione lyase family enzyme